MRRVSMRAAIAGIGSILAAAVMIQVAQADNPVILEVSAPILPGRGNAVPFGITGGGDGALWAIVGGGSQYIGRITTDRVVTPYPIPVDGNMSAIATAADGSVWYTEDAALFRLSMDGHFTQYPLQVHGTFNEAQSIARGSDGNMYVGVKTNTAGAFLERVTPAGAVTSFPLGGHTCPGGHFCGDVLSLAAGPDGNLWFGGPAPGKVGRMTLGGTVQLFAVIGSNVDAITSGPDGNIWFSTDGFAENAIGHIHPDGTQLSEFAIPTQFAGIRGITGGPDGNVWFTERNAGKIGKVDPSNNVIEYALPSADGFPTGMVTGPDGNIWFAESNPTAGRFGEVDFDGALEPNTPVTIATTEGAAATGVVGGFGDASPGGTTADFTATINWGDGFSSGGTVSGPIGGPFRVSGAHTYAEEGSYPTSVKVVDVGGSTVALTGTAIVGDGGLAAIGGNVAGAEAGFTALAVPAQGVVATFTDADPGGRTSDYSATINWGDGTATTGTISGPTSGSGPRHVSGSHLYAEDGPYTITVTIRDAGGAQTAINGTGSMKDRPALIDQLSEDENDE